MAYIQVPGTGKSHDEVIKAACAALGCAPWGGVSANGWSKAGDFQRCARRYQLRHLCQLQSPLKTVGGALDTGSYTHLMLAAHYAAMLPPNYPGWQRVIPAPDDLLRACADHGASMESIAMSQRLFDGYLEHWANENWTPVAVEMEAGDPNFHTCRFDLVVHVEDGFHDGLWLTDHKSGGSATDWEAYQLDGEILGEMWAFQHERLFETFGAPLMGVCINGLVKKKVPEFRREWIPFDPVALETFVLGRTYTNFLIRQLTQMSLKTEGLWPATYNGCRGIYGRCEFFEACLTNNFDDLQPVKK